MDIELVAEAILNETRVMNDLNPVFINEIEEHGKQYYIALANAAVRSYKAQISNGV